MVRKVKRSTKKFREQKLPCAERGRLEKAYDEARQKEVALQIPTDDVAMSGDSSKFREARNKRLAGLGHATHILNELLAHERSHGCTDRKKTDAKLPSNED